MRALGVRLIAIIALLLATPLVAASQTVSAVWDPNPPTDLVVNYEVCVGTTSLSCNFRDVTVPATQTSYTFIPNAGVLYRVAVRAISAVGAGPYSSEILVSVPSLATIANRTSTVNTAITSFTPSASDPDGSPLTYTHTGLPFGLTLNQSTGQISGTPSSVGSYNVTIFVTDGLSTASAAFTWTIQNGSSSDTTAPTLSITSHTPGQTVTTSSITLAGTATDSGAGNSGITSVTVNGGAATGGTATGSNTANWSRSVTLSAGANTLTVVATDGAGNARTSTISITSSVPDTTTPNLTITTPTSGQMVSASSITVSGTASDSGRGGSGITSVTVNGTAAVGGTASGNGTANWSSPVALAAGANTITVIATDGAGNNRQSQVTVNRDSSAPALSITSHTSGQTVTTSSITVAGTASDAATGGNGITSVTVNGSTATGGTASGTGTASWSRSVSLAAGANTITVVARDGASNSTTSMITINRANAAVSSATLNSDLASPQMISTPITFSASGAGGVTPYQYKFLVQQGSGAPQMVRNWSTTATYVWTPTVGGSYNVIVWVRTAGGTVDAADASAQAAFTIMAPLSLTGLTSNLPSPQTTGTPITFTAAAAGGTAPYQYKFWLTVDGVNWTIVQNWSNAATYTLTPNVAGSNYRIGVWVRDATTTADTSSVAVNIPYVITAGAPAPTPLSIVTFTSNVASPQAPGTSITFSTTATGGTAPYSTKWLVFDGVSWTTARNWAVNSSFTWTPSSANDNYRVMVWVRDATTTADTSAVQAQVVYPIQASAPAPVPPSTPPSVTGLSSNLASPQAPGTSIAFSASVTGGAAPYSTKWWVFNGTSWTMVRDWAVGTSYTWTPTVASANYQVGVWVRDATMTSDVNSYTRSMAFVISGGSSTPPPPPPPPTVTTPVTLQGLTTNLPSPQAPGTAVTFSASVTGGTTPYSTKWWVFNGVSWTLARDWANGTSYTWTPTVANSNYAVGVWVRDATTTADVSSNATWIPFVIAGAATPPPPPPPPTGTPLSLQSLTSNVPSAQLPGTTITFTTTARGGTAPYSFKYWLFNGTSWTVARDWSTNASFAWTPSVPGSNYRITVWVRDATSVADVGTVTATVPYVIAYPPPPEEPEP